MRAGFEVLAGGELAGSNSRSLRPVMRRAAILASGMPVALET
jgi:hypothetical protein